MRPWLALFLAAGIGAAGADPRPPLPETVLAALGDLFPGHEVHVDEVEREREKGTWVYEVEGETGGGRFEVEIDAHGRVLEVETGGVDPAWTPELPPAVAEAVRSAVPGFRIREVEIEWENGEAIYEVSGTAGGRKVEIEVTAGGEIMEIEGRYPGPPPPWRDRLSEEALATLDAAVPGFSIGHLEEDERAGLSFFRVSGRFRGREVTMEILTEGPLLSLSEDGRGCSARRGEEVPVAALPEALTRTVVAVAPGFHYGEVRLRTCPGESFHALEGLRNGHRMSLLLSADGRVRAAETDSDRDGLLDPDERDLTRTDPGRWDSDGDGFPDGFEWAQGADPLATDQQPNLLEIEKSGDALRLRVTTFPGGLFDLEHCPDGIHWSTVGEAFAGDGGVREVAFPLGRQGVCGMFRVALRTVESAPAAREPGDGECPVPSSLAGLHFVLDFGEGAGDDRQLQFRADGTGQRVEITGEDVEVEPFSYTVRHLDACRVEVVVAFPREGADHLVTYELDFSTPGQGRVTRTEPGAATLTGTFSYGQAP